MRNVISLALIIVLLLSVVSITVAQDQDQNVCLISAGAAINIRTAASTDSAVLDILSSGETRTVIGQVAGSDGFLWWQLEAGGWVREDTVVASGNCIFDEVSLTIINYFSIPICYVNLPLTTDPDWGLDRLGATEVIQPGAERRWMVNRGIYDLWLGDCDGETLVEIYQVDVTRDYRLEAGTSAPLDDPLAEAMRLNDFGQQAYNQEHYEEALDYYGQALAIVRELNDRAGEAAILNNMGAVYDVQGQYEQALDYYEQALMLARAMGNRYGEGVANNNIGIIYAAQEQYPKALEFYQQALVIRREVGDRAGEGKTLQNIGTVYFDQGQYGLALENYQQFLTITRELSDRASEGTALNNLGAVYDSQGQYEAAMDCYEQALTIIQTLGDREGEGSTLNNIGSVYENLAQYELALDYYQQALAIRREVGDQSGEGTTLNNIGSVYVEQGQYEAALDYYQQALAIARETHNQSYEARTLNNIGAVYSGRGQYEPALSYYQQALAIAREVGDYAGEGIAINNIGGIYSSQAQYADALDYYQQALVIAREIGDRAGEEEILYRIGITYHAQGQYAAALDYYQRGLTIAREIGDRAGEGTALNNFGGVYDVQGQASLALDYYQQALAIQREIGGRSSESETLNNIGAVYERENQHELALDYHQQALAILRAIGDRAGEGTSLNNIGSVYFNQAWYAEALDYYQQALVVQREVGDRDGEGSTLNNIGSVYYDQDQPDLALDYYQQALVIAREIQNRADEGAALINIGSVYLFLLDQPTPAIDWYQQAVAVQESLFQATVLDQGISSLIGKNAYLYARLASLFIQEGDLLNALEYAERGRGILMRDELRGEIVDFRANLNDQALLDEEEQLRLEVIDAQNLVNALNTDLSATGQDKQNAQRALNDARAAYDRHLEQMQLGGGFLARELALDVASLAEIQAALAEDTTLILYGISPYDSYVLLVTPDDLRGVVLDTTVEDIATVLQTFAADRRAHAAALQDLYNLLVAPVADAITTQNLIISVSDLLNYVPFSALQAPDGSYLSDHYTLSMIPSGTVLVLLDQRESNSAARVSGVVLAQRDALGLPRLQHAQQEAEAIATSLGVTPLLDASEYDLRERSTGAAVIHISAHAELDRFDPLYSAIYLGEDDNYDGRLEVREIFELDLSQGTELVVLSGCETAAGGTGEDFGLLSRAFMAAGTDKVVASLWSVDDAATAELLVAFIDARVNTDNDAEALRSAMQGIREIYPEPYYWASFVLVGPP